MTEIQKAMGLEFLKYKVENLEESLEYKQSVLVDGSALLFGLDVVKRWVHDKTHLIVIPVYAIDTLDLYKNVSDAETQHLSRCASAFIEKELKKGGVRLQQGVKLVENHAANVANALRPLSAEFKLVVARCSQDSEGRLNIDETTHHAEQAGYSVDLLLPAEIEDAKLWHKQRQLRYLKRKNGKK